MSTDGGLVPHVSDQIIGVTGADGFFGWHTRCRLFTQGRRWLCADRATFANTDLLDEFVKSCDVILHLAGVNRANSDSDIVEGNIALAKDLIDARTRTGARFDVIYANSVKADEPGPYGESKRKAAELLALDAAATGCNFTNVLFPHLYGEFGVPFYNSAVTTFAHQLAIGAPSQVSDGILKLLHVQDAAQILIDALSNTGAHATRPSGIELSVAECYSMMSRLAGYCELGTIPAIGDDHLELRLFNTIRSQLWPDAYPMPLVRHSDQRGSFFEVIRAWGQGQTSISTTVPGVTRGEHYHLNKVERFAVISGQATIRVRRLFTDQVHSFGVQGDEPVFVDMPPLCTHDITNTGQAELVTLFWSHDHFDPAAADTYPLKVVGEDLLA